MICMRDYAGWDNVINAKRKSKTCTSAVRSTKNNLIKTQLCKLRVKLQSRVLQVVYTLAKETGR